MSISELQPHIRGWLLASANGTKMGIIPTNYVKVVGKRRGTKSRPVPPTNNATSVLAPETNPQTVPENVMHANQDFPNCESVVESQSSNMDSLWKDENTEP